MGRRGFAPRRGVAGALRVSPQGRSKGPAGDGGGASSLGMHFFNAAYLFPARCRRATAIGPGPRRTVRSERLGRDVGCPGVVTWVSWQARFTRTHTRARARARVDARAHAHAHAHRHMHTRARARAHTQTHTHTQVRKIWKRVISVASLDPD